VRVVVVASRSPTPVVDGYGVHLEGVLRALRTDHDIHVVCYGDAPVDIDGVTSTVMELPPERRDLPFRLRIAARGLVVGEPALARQYREGGLGEAVARVVAEQRFDVAHVTPTPTAFAADALGGLPRVLDMVDDWALNQEQVAAAGRGGRALLQRITLTTIRRYQRQAMLDYRAAVVVAARDRESLLATCPSARVEVIPNGVDTDFFAPNPAIARVPGLVAFHGAMDYPPNIDAAEYAATEVMPLVRAQRPDARLRIIGRRPHDRVRALAGDFVEVTGDVADVRVPLLGAEVALCPMRRGSGIKNKLLEAGSLGLPLVATSSALGDIDLVHGEHLLIGDRPDDLAAALVELLGDPRQRDRLGTAARARIVAAWGWDRAAAAFTALYREVADLKS
jgi:glycosyltransferase involved in cell wall biosynthesis